MPFRSKKQRAYMYIHHPDIAKRWTKKYGSEPQPSKKGKRKRKTQKRDSRGRFA